MLLGEGGVTVLLGGGGVTVLLVGGRVTVLLGEGGVTKRASFQLWETYLLFSGNNELMRFLITNSGS